jgi:hypothetical protein
MTSRGKNKKVAQDPLEQVRHKANVTGKLPYLILAMFFIMFVFV